MEAGPFGDPRQMCVVVETRRAVTVGDGVVRCIRVVERRDEPRRPACLFRDLFKVAFYVLYCPAGRHPKAAKETRNVVGVQSLKPLTQVALMSLSVGGEPVL